MFTTGGVMLAAVAATLLGGCAAGNRTDGHAPHADVAGMTCPKCQTVWVAPKATPGGSPKVQAMQWGRQAVCPDCDVMARAYLKDGEKVLHNCPTCKVVPRPATRVTPTHPKGTHI
jgi:phage FluMu protein Com